MGANDRVRVAVAGINGRGQAHRRAYGEMPDVAGVVEALPGRDAVELVLEPDTTPQQVLDRLRDRGAVINRFEITTPSLHSIFLSMVGGDHG